MEEYSPDSDVIGADSTVAATPEAESEAVLSGDPTNNGLLFNGDLLHVAPDTNEGQARDFHTKVSESMAAASGGESRDGKSGTAKAGTDTLHLERRTFI